MSPVSVNKTNGASCLCNLLIVLKSFPQKINDSKKASILRHSFYRCYLSRTSNWWTQHKIAIIKFPKKRFILKNELKIKEIHLMAQIKTPTTRTLKMNRNSEKMGNKRKMHLTPFAIQYFFQRTVFSDCWSSYCYYHLLLLLLLAQLHP